MSFVAYKITHRESGKAYIGVTTQKNPRTRWRWHIRMGKFAIGAAIRKYGRASFDFDVYASAADATSLLALERILIAQENTLAPNGYNLCAGGLGVLTPSEETLERKRLAALGKVWTEEQKARHAIVLTGRKMPPRSEEHRAKLSASLKGRCISSFSPEMRAKISAANTGKKRHPEVGQKISAIKLGVPRSEEAKAAMRAGWAARKARLEKDAA